MYEQHYITHAQYMNGTQHAAADAASEIQQPAAAAVGRAVLHQLGRAAGRARARERGPRPKQAQYEAYYGGLKIKLSIDLDMQNAGPAA